MMTARVPMFFFLSLAALFIFSLAPYPVHATGLAGDAMCTPVIPSCPCGTVPGPNGCIGGSNKFMCPPGVCIDTTNGFSTPGTCIAPNKCKALSTSGPDGFGLDIVKSMLGSLMQKLMSPQPSGSGGGSGGTGDTSGSTPTGCSTYAPTSDVSQVSTSNTGGVCYYYQAPLSSLLNGTGTADHSGTSLSDLLNSMTDNNANTLSNNNANTSGSLNRQLNANVTSATTPASTTTSATSPSVTGGLMSGIHGDMQVFSTGVTILAGSVDANGNAASAGFFGADTTTGQPVSTIVNLCKARPWSKNLLAYAIPATFFDSLCVMRGYSVGIEKAAVSAVKIVQRVATSTAASSTAPVLPPKVDIWAVPGSVSLGARASIFWTSQGVKDCTITSLDGTFSQSSTSGSASTVALTKSTIFTISCTAPDGKPVINSVAVTVSS